MQNNQAQGHSKNNMRKSQAQAKTGIKLGGAGIDGAY
jgi:hypothetical protein